VLAAGGKLLIGERHRVKRQIQYRISGFNRYFSIRKLGLMHNYGARVAQSFSRRRETANRYLITV
jgi:hypothetical protein